MCFMLFDAETEIYGGKASEIINAMLVVKYVHTILVAVFIILFLLHAHSLTLNKINVLPGPQDKNEKSVKAHLNCSVRV